MKRRTDTAKARDMVALILIMVCALLILRLLDFLTDAMAVDDYDNSEGGFNLKASESIAYLKILANYAHTVGSSKRTSSRKRSIAGIGIGLKHAGAIVGDVVGFLDWVVNEQCVQCDECDTL